MATEILTPKTTRFSPRSVLLGLFVGPIAIVIAMYTVLATAYMPLTEGGGSGPDTVSGMYLRSEADPFGTGSMYVYCSAADREFAWFISLRNDGPIPLTIEGGDTVPGYAPDPLHSNGFWFTDLAAFRQAEPTETPSQSHLWTDPRSAPVLATTVLGPGEDLELWARFKTGSLVLGSGTAMSIRSLWVRYSILGLERTVEVPLRDGVQVEGSPCAVAKA